MFSSDSCLACAIHEQLWAEVFLAHLMVVLVLRFDSTAWHKTSEFTVEGLPVCALTSRLKFPFLNCWNQNFAILCDTKPSPPTPQISLADISCPCRFTGENFRISHDRVRSYLYQVDNTGFPVVCYSYLHNAHVQSNYLTQNDSSKHLLLFNRPDKWGDIIIKNIAVFNKWNRRTSDKITQISMYVI